MKSLIIVIFLSFAAVCTGQIDITNQSLTDSSLSYLYIGVDNRVKVTGPTGNTKLVIAGGGGTYLKEGTDMYIVRVSSVTDLCELTLVKGTKNIFHKRYKVREIPRPVATAGGLKDTTVRVAVLLTNPFVSIRFPGCYFRVIYRVVSFSATFIQGGDSVLTNTTGHMFSQDQIATIKLLKPGDKIFFDNIRAVSPDGKSQKLPPFWIKIE